MSGFTPADEDLELPPDAPASREASMPLDNLARAQELADYDTTSERESAKAQALALIDIATSLREIKSELHGIRRGL